MDSHIARLLVMLNGETVACQYFGQVAIGLDMQKLNDKKQRFLNEIVPKWIDEAKE